MMTILQSSLDFLGKIAIIIVALGVISTYSIKTWGSSTVFERAEAGNSSLAPLLSIGFWMIPILAPLAVLSLGPLSILEAKILLASVSVLIVGGIDMLTIHKRQRPWMLWTFLLFHIIFATITIFQAVAYFAPTTTDHNGFIVCYLVLSLLSNYMLGIANGSRVTKYVGKGKMYEIVMTTNSTLGTFIATVSTDKQGDFILEKWVTNEEIWIKRADVTSRLALRPGITVEVTFTNATTKQLKYLKTTKDHFDFLGESHPKDDITAITFISL